MRDGCLLDTLLRATSRDRPDDLVCAYLFGSRARGDASLGSDLDVAVLFAADTPRFP